jgi:hypothetical protein
MTIETLVHSRLPRSLVCALAAAAFAAPAAVADPPQGHRAPPSNVVDRYLANDRTHVGQPTRTADAIEPHVASRAGITARTPDGYQPSRHGQTRAAAASQSSSDGFSWGDAGIGAAFGFAFSVIATGTLLATRGRQRMAHS